MDAPPYFTLFLLFLFYLISISKAVLVNVTVDDSASGITYLPTPFWSVGQTCGGCSAKPDIDRMFDGTWHDGAYIPANTNADPTGPLNISFTFTGSAIYVFCATKDNSSMLFYIDGEIVGQYENQDQNFAYNVLVYSNMSIAAGEHEFKLQNGQFGNAGNKSLTLFDYLVYSYDDGSSPTTSSASVASSSSSASAASTASTASSSSSSSTSVGPIVGGVVGGITGLAVVALAIWFLLRRKNAAYIESKKPSSFIVGLATHPVTSSMSGSVALRYGVGTGKHSRQPPGHQGHDTPPPTSSGAVVGFSSVTPLAPRRELDAGPAIAEVENDEDQTLPPEYGQVFTQARGG